LLVADVDFENGYFAVRSKPWLFWTVKTGRERKLPLFDTTRHCWRIASATGKPGSCS
jgi:hypothetical protein